MTPDEAIAIVNRKSDGRPRWKDSPPWLDEVLVIEIQRLRDEVLELENRCRSYADIALDNDRLRDENANLDAACKIADRRNERLLAALKALHDHAVDYARLNNLFNSDGTPATFNELLQARAAIAEAEGRES